MSWNTWIAVVFLMLGCSKGNTHGHGDAAEGHSIVFAAAMAEREVITSPIRHVAGGFTRIGVQWDAENLDNLQIASSIDGKHFSEFKTLTILYREQGRRQLGVGVYDAPAAANYYRLKIDAGRAPSHMKLDFLKETHHLPKYSVSRESQSTDDSKSDQALVDLLEGKVFVSREAWGAAATPDCTDQMGVTGIVLHHTADPNQDVETGESRMRLTQNYHMQVNEWCDVGYHFLIGQDGRIFEGRRLPLMGAHAKGANRDNIGIALMGNFEEGDPTEDQMASVKILMKAIADRYEIDINHENFKGHREAGTTATLCPGARLFAMMDDLIGEVGELLALR